MKIVVTIPKDLVSEQQYTQVIEAIDNAIDNEGVPQFDIEWDSYAENKS